LLSLPLPIPGSISIHDLCLFLCHLEDSSGLKLPERSVIFLFVCWCSIGIITTTFFFFFVELQYESSSLYIINIMEPILQAYTVLRFIMSISLDINLKYSWAITKLIIIVLLDLLK
jgi:hypothetical protein